jgi:HD-GYP domain-containing protein (c-di-GMP phosphodiesterase class II)
MRTHTKLGERIVSHVPFLAGVACEVIACHHEWWSGGGYPRGLSGVATPLSARVFALVDAFDAMTHDRPYRSALPFAEATRRIRAGAGTQFDPTLAKAFLRLVGDGRA